MSKIILEISNEVYKVVWSHLLPKKFLTEEVAFIFANRIVKDGNDVFRYLEWSPVLPDGFLTRSRYYLELANDTRADAIKRAHDLNASLIELHSHYGLWPAQFSESDLFGFKEFVPHVWWRLKNRPYMAIVVSKSGFDGLAWVSNPREARYIDAIIADGVKLTPTKLSLLRGDSYDARTL
jgi:hypothetical protein